MLGYAEMTLSETKNFKITDNIIFPAVCIFKVKKIIVALTRNKQNKTNKSTLQVLYVDSCGENKLNFNMHLF